MELAKARLSLLLYRRSSNGEGHVRPPLGLTRPLRKRFPREGDKLHFTIQQGDEGPEAQEVKRSGRNILPRIPGQRTPPGHMVRIWRLKLWLAYTLPELLRGVIIAACKD
ncbi:hypothetical protein E2C01_018624 [Portunus trituberculatus]|uniref:Uncharacterized protein n=1 Tax=Portunus trituberculatus TaxID=210409 RepID=A0A5B7DWN7_PORTR|nr:hypothetical protein [Portunus trituberculatus]